MIPTNNSKKSRGPITLSCLRCGKEFSVETSRKNTAKFCSISCGGLARGDKSKVTLICKKCGTGFRLSPAQAKNSKGYCGKACGYAGRRDKVINTTCISCERDFVAHKEGVKYCSTNCWSFHQRRLAGIPSVKNGTGRCIRCDHPLIGASDRKRYCAGCRYIIRRKHELKCRTCGKEFRDPENKKKYCSVPCAAIGATKRLTKSCEQCGAPFTYGASREIARFCSKRCDGNSRRVALSARECKWCGSEFFVNLKRQPGSFFSRKCCGHFVRCHSGWSQNKRSSLEIATAKALTQLGISYQEQVPIGPWIVDFLILDRNLIIESDGGYWHSQPRAVAKDNSKFAYLKKLQYTVIRLSEKEIKKDVLGAVKTALAASL